MQIFTRYYHQTQNEIQPYSIELTDNVCICSKDNNNIILNWNGESLSGDLSEELRNEIANLIISIIQNAQNAGLFLGIE